MNELIAKQMNELKHVEQELTHLQAQLEKSFAVVDSLAQIQAQFEGLAVTYQQLRDFLERAKSQPSQASEVEQRLLQRFEPFQTLMESQLVQLRSELSSVQQKLTSSVTELAQLKESFEQRTTRVEGLTESIWKEVRSELVKAQNQVDASNRNLGAQLTQQVSNLKHELESKMAAVLQQWMSQADLMHLPLEELESRLKDDWKSLFEELSEAGFTPENFRKLDSRIQGNKLSVRNLEKQLKTMRVWLFVAVSTAVLSVSSSFLLVARYSLDKESPAAAPAGESQQEPPSDSNSSLPSSFHSARLFSDTMRIE